jgi:hypothetical protein
MNDVIRPSKTYDNARKLIEYLRASQPATVARVVNDGVLNSRDASDAMQFGVRHGVIERIKRQGERPGERVAYRLTGHPLAEPRKGDVSPSFDALLGAWGIAQVPLEMPSEPTRVFRLG